MVELMLCGSLKLQFIHIKEMEDNMMNSLILLSFKAISSVSHKVRCELKDKAKLEGAKGVLKSAFVDVCDWCHQLFSSNINMDDCSP